MDDTQTTSPATEDYEDAPTQTHAQLPAGEDAPSGPPGFSERGRMRRRMRFLRKARELAYRDLGGLVFDLHRFGRRNDALVLAKLETIGRIDGELRALQDTLAERRPVTVLREAGVAACPRCAAIHGSEDRFCPNCGLAMDLRAERPMAGPQSAVPAPAPAPPPPPTPTPAPAPAPAPATPTTAHTPAPAKPASDETPPHAPVGETPTTATPAPSSTAEPSAPSTATPAMPAPSTATTPAPGTPTPRAPTPKAAPAPATARPTPTPTRAQDDTPPTGTTPADDTPPTDDTPPADAAPAIGDGFSVGRERPNVDQPTEIVRPPNRNP